jgi:hypothetical protein
MNGKFEFDYSEKDARGWQVGNWLKDRGEISIEHVGATKGCWAIDLPSHLQTVTSTDSFKRQLKTHLFNTLI